ncbi:MAG TPA: lytic murein transglycosylase [Solirubrobacterales bacterium]|jgi:soluble lytic murein transglycosylase-like protein|nr:lytic murein transglycosylase [Solirubrobacterales bacterium]
MKRADKIRTAVAVAVATVALSAPFAARAAGAEPVSAGATLEEPASALAAPTADPAPLQQGTTLAPPAPTATEPPAASGGVSAGNGAGDAGAEEAAAPTEGTAGALPALPSPSAVLPIPSLPASTCAATGVPPMLIPIYQRAAATYALGPQGPAVLAGINQVETAFGTNLGPSSAGAVGWMQFMPETWAGYGVDANGDGVADPNDPEDAIYAAASYLSASGMPADTYGAIYAYNHADWYVAEVLANAGCYAGAVGGPGLAATLSPQLQVLKCEAAPDWKAKIPHEYMRAFEDAAARYELGKRGVWTLAAIAHLESNFGRGLDKRQLHEEGPLGLDASEWNAYAVDGDEDGRIRHGDPVDSAATLARMIWSRGSLSAGVFTHNQAEWYVQLVQQEAARIEGECQSRYVDWALAPLANGLETAGASAVLTGTLASSPRNAPPAIKAAIAAANSITTTPYVWGGGHGSWYSYGYDCSGAVSFALYGAGLLGTPLTSGSLESYGEPGPGNWITIYANATHAYMTIAGLRFDTAGNPAGVSGPRWHSEPPYPEGFVVRHPVGY